MHNQVVSTQHFVPTSPIEKSIVILSIKKTNSTGFDGFSIRLIQIAANALNLPRSTIFNNHSLFCLRIFSNVLKFAKVTRSRIL